MKVTDEHLRETMAIFKPGARSYEMAAELLRLRALRDLLLAYTELASDQGPGSLQPEYDARDRLDAAIAAEREAVKKERGE